MYEELRKHTSCIPNTKVCFYMRGVFMCKLDYSVDDSFEELHASYNDLLKQLERQKDYNDKLISVLKYHKIRVPQFETPHEISF